MANWNKNKYGIILKYQNEIKSEKEWSVLFHFLTRDKPATKRAQFRGELETKWILSHTESDDSETSSGKRKNAIGNVISRSQY